MIQVSDISVIITCYKEQELLYRAFQSLENQVVTGFEIILVNDCSPDSITNQICEVLSQKPNVQYIRRPSNGGLSASRNAGFETMKGLLAVPLDADDTLPENAIENILNTWNTYPDADMLWGDYTIINEKNDVNEISCKNLATKDNCLDVNKLAKNWILIGTAPCTKRIWSIINGYNVKFTNTTQDVDFWRRAFLQNIKGYYIPYSIYNWYKLNTGMNSQVKEEDYVLLRIDSLPFYDVFYPEYGIKMREYIYRYYSQRLQVKELQEFVSKENTYFSFIQKCKSYIMSCTLLYKILRKLKNTLLQLFS